MSGSRGDRSWLRTTWPLDRRDWLQLGVALVLVVGVFSAVGWLFTDALAPNAITRVDDRVAEDLVSMRTEVRTDLAHWGSMLAQTQVKIAATFVVAVVMLVVWKRWHETVFLALSLIFEATAFITITAIVGRSRPDVERLLDSPVDSSYPSGHVAAATVYGAFVVIVFWHTRRRWIRALAIGLCTAVVVAVGLSRMYQGMHFLSDVVAGIALGLVSLWICVRVLGAPGDSDGGESVDDEEEPEPVTGSSISAAPPGTDPGAAPISARPRT